MKKQSEMEKRFRKREEKLERKERELVAYGEQLDRIKETYDAYHQELMVKFDDISKREVAIAQKEAELEKREADLVAFQHHIHEWTNYLESLKVQSTRLQKQLSKSRLQGMKPAVLLSSSSASKKKLMPPTKK